MLYIVYNIIYIVSRNYHFHAHETSIKSRANRFNDHYRKYSYYVLIPIAYIILYTLLVCKDNVISTKHLTEIIVRFKNQFI